MPYIDSTMHYIIAGNDRLLTLWKKVCIFDPQRLTKDTKANPK